MGCVLNKGEKMKTVVKFGIFVAYIIEIRQAELKNYILRTK